MRSSSVVIRNEFSVSDGHGGGSRGATPGNYVLDYISRLDKVEALSPVRIDDDDSIQARMSRRLDMSYSDDLFERVRNDSGYGGVAMGGEGSEFSISWPRKRAAEASRRIQRLFDEGHTVLKTVISFSGDYLRERGVVKDDFVCEQAGGYRGHIDQLKLRQAIGAGVSSLSSTFDSLVWVGAIHLDTDDVHAHLALVDAGEGRRAVDGTQKGKLTAAEMHRMRVCMDDALREMSPLVPFVVDRQQDMDHARSVVDRAIMDEARRRGFVQLVVACLPQDKSIWHVDSFDPRMSRANAVLREFVEDVVSRADSGMDDVLARAREDAVRDGYRDVDAVCAAVREDVVRGCMESVYATLSTVDFDEMQVRTPFLHAMSVSESSLADDTSGMARFGLRLRTVHARLEHHVRERERWHSLAQDFRDNEQVAEGAAALLRMYEIEERYHAMLIAKYRSMLRILRSDEEYGEDLEELQRLWEVYRRTEAMTSDLRIRRASPEEAERLGVSRHGVSGGRFVAMDDDVAKRRLRRAQRAYERAFSDLACKVEADGMSLHMGENGRAHVSAELAYPFQDVKGLDLHDLAWEFDSDVVVSRSVVRAFDGACREREVALERARDYLVASGQVDMFSVLPVSDVSRMRACASRMLRRSVLDRAPASAPERGRATVSLDSDCVSRVEAAVLASIV